jgi:hypothetical protein
MCLCGGTTGRYRVSWFNQDDDIREVVERDCECAANKEAKACLILSGDGRTIEGQPELVCRESPGPTTHE